MQLRLQHQVKNYIEILNLNVTQTSRATTTEDLQQPAYDGLEKSYEFDESSDKDYVVDQFTMLLRRKNK